MIYFPSDSIIIYRSRPKGTDKFRFSATFTPFQADIQPVESTRIADVGGRLGKTYDAWIDATIDVQEGDQVRVGTKKYGVKAISTWQGAGLLDHKHLILESRD